MTATPPNPPRVGESIEYGRFLDCVHCGLCTAACPTYLETGDENNGPRGRIYLMRAVVDGRLDLTPAVRNHLDLCLDCRSCETACPSGVQYGRLIEPFRNEMHAGAAGKSGPSSWIEKTILYGIFPYPDRVKWALLPAKVLQRAGLDRVFLHRRVTRFLPQFLQRMTRVLPQVAPSETPLPEFLPAIGPRRATVAMLTGCVQEAMFAGTNRATARVLQHNGCDVHIPRGQGCCAAIHYHSGAGDEALKVATALVDRIPVDKVDAVITNVAGCGSTLKEYGHIAHEIAPKDAALRERLEHFSAKVKDVNEFLATLGTVPPTGRIEKRAVYHDACHLVHAQKIRLQPRQLLALIPGLTVVPLAESEICCGAAGSYNLTQPEMADRLGQRKLSNIQAAKPDLVISANAGCTLQMQAMIRDAGLDIPVVHPVDLLAESYRLGSAGTA